MLNCSKRLVYGGKKVTWMLDDGNDESKLVVFWFAYFYGDIFKLRVSPYEKLMMSHPIPRHII